MEEARTDEGQAGQDGDGLPRRHLPHERQIPHVLYMDASLSVVKKLEHGDHIPTMQTVFIFCRALDIEPRDFITEVTHRLAFLEGNTRN